MATQAMLGAGATVLGQRGRWHARGDGVPVLATVHPSYLLRLPPGARPAAWEAFLADLRMLQSALNGQAAIGPTTEELRP
jgi:DNA polymerase